MSDDECDVYDFEHVQLAMPPGQEALARRFYAEALGLAEVAKPADLALRGGCWFEGGTLRLHLGVEAEFRAARKAHPALLVHNLPALRRRLISKGFPPREDAPLEGFDRCYVDDPFGNRIELMEPQAG